MRRALEASSRLLPRLAYLSQRSGAEAGLSLVFQSLEDGGVRQLRLPIDTLLQPSWSSDSRSIVGLGRGAAGAGLYRVDVTTGDATLLFTDASLPQLSADSSKLYSLRPHGRPPYEFVERTLASGRERILLRNHVTMYAVVSPDQHVSAVLATEGEQAPALRRLVLVPLAGGATRELFQSKQLTFLVRWTADSRNVLICDAGRVGTVPLDGGEPRWLDLRIVPPPQRPEHLAVHPDGERLVHMTGGSKIETIGSIREPPKLTEARCHGAERTRDPDALSASAVTASAEFPRLF